MALNRAQMSAITSSKTDLWATPQWFFDRLNEEFHFQTDVCALPENAKCQHYFSPDLDGLQQQWAGMCWMNPPYGREISKWVKKAMLSAMDGNTTVVCLLPARTDTKWFHDYCRHAEVRLLKGRLKFGTAQESAPFPNMVVIFHAHLKPAGIISYWSPTR